MRFESHLGHVFSPLRGFFSLCVLTKQPKVLTAAYVFRVASIRKRTKKDGTASYMVLWRDPNSREQQGLTVGTLVEAETLKRLLDANGQSFEIAQHAILSNEKRTPTVAEVPSYSERNRPCTGGQTGLPADRTLGEVDDGQGQGAEDHP